MGNVVYQSYHPNGFSSESILVGIIKGRSSDFPRSAEPSRIFLGYSGSIQRSKKWDYSSWDCSGFTPDSLLITDQMIWFVNLRIRAKGRKTFRYGEEALFFVMSFLSLGHEKITYIHPPLLYRMGFTH